MKRIQEEEEVCFRLILCNCSEVQNFECYRSNTVVNRIENRFIYVNQIELKYFFELECSGLHSAQFVKPLYDLSLDVADKLFHMHC